MRSSFVTAAVLALAGCAAAPEDTCFSPTQNLEEAYVAGAVGCACDPATDAAQCVPDSTGRRVALVCDDGVWNSVEDGPCAVP